jgi:hypothetical protein
VKSIKTASSLLSIVISSFPEFWTKTTLELPPPKKSFVVRGQLGRELETGYVAKI